MFGKIISWFINQITKIIESSTELKETIQQTNLTKESNKLLEDKLKYLKLKQKRHQIQEKIYDLEEDEYEDEEQELQLNTEKESGLDENKLLISLISKLFTQPTHPIEADNKPALSPQFIEIIKKAKSHKELIPLAKQFFPTADEDTIKTIWTSFQ